MTPLPSEPTPGSAVLVALMHRYLAGFMDPSISLLEAQKLMYFAQEAGEPLRLRYEKGPCGPWAEDLRHLLAAVEGHLVSGHGDGRGTPDAPLALVPGAFEEARAFLERHPETLARMERVAKLIEGCESPFGTDLLSTVHWVTTREQAQNVAAVVRAVDAWRPRELVFTTRQIELTIRRLEDAGWIRLPGQPPGGAHA